MIATCDKPIKQIARDLAVPHTLYAWHSKHQNQHEGTAKKLAVINPNADQKKIKELQKKVKELEMEKEILKKAMGFFMPRPK